MSESLNTLKVAVKAIAELEPGDLVRKEELGRDFHFEAEIPLLEAVVGLFRELNEVELGHLPEGKCAELKDAADSVFDAVRAIALFKPGEVARPADQRKDVADQLRRTYERVFTPVSAVVAYASSRETHLGQAWEGAARAVDQIEELRKSADQELRASLKTVEEKLRVLRTDSESEMRTLRKRIANELESSQRNAEASLRDYDKRAEGIVESIKRAAGAAGVGTRADMFGAEAQRHATARTTWLKASISVAALAGLFAVGNVVYLVLCGSPEIEPGPAIELAVAKILLFSVLYFALVWVVRTYRAASHNEIVNQHRRNALLTFEAFVAASADDQTKEAVLLRATECVFGHQVSGFSDPGRDDGGSSRLLEVIRGVRAGTDDR